jgi:hypothetical protein
MGEVMTVQELYDWCKQNDLTDAKIEIVGDRAVYDEITERNIVEYGKSVSSQEQEKYIVFELV